MSLVWTGVGNPSHAPTLNFNFTLSVPPKYIHVRHPRALCSKDLLGACHIMDTFLLVAV
jgi:hypothetical protein